MERKFPKNVRQIGNVCDTPKIYVEDYVDTYLNQLKGRMDTEISGALLLGEKVVAEEQECVYITGAVQLREVGENKGDLNIAEDVFQEAEKECREYFPEKEIVGWCLLVSGRPMTLSAGMIRMHEKLPVRRNCIFVLKNAEEDEEIYFAYKYHELMQMGGYCVFYEKNPDMQNYMINTRKQIGVTPSEVVEDRAAKNFRSAIKGKMEIQEQRNSSRFVYMTSALLVIVVLAIGVSAMNNYDKMNSVQSSIETLSKSVQGEEEAEEVPGEKREDPSAEEAGMAEEYTTTVQEESQSGAEYYTVQRGDTLDRISMKLYGTADETEAICKMNGLEDGNLIFIGQKLLLP